MSSASPCLRRHIRTASVIGRHRLDSKSLEFDSLTTMRYQNRKAAKVLKARKSWGLLLRGKRCLLLLRSSLKDRRYDSRGQGSGRETLAKPRAGRFELYILLDSWCEARALEYDCGAVRDWVGGSVIDREVGNNGNTVCSRVVARGGPASYLVLATGLAAEPRMLCCHHEVGR